MIRKPTKDELYQLKHHLGPTAFGYFMHLINELAGDEVPVEENNHARRPTPIDSENPGLSGPESGERSA